MRELSHEKYQRDQAYTERTMRGGLIEWRNTLKLLQETEQNLARQAEDSSFQIRQIATGMEKYDARKGIELLTDSTRLGMETAETALQSMDELRR
ncbi:hypothetical protein [Pseudomonas lini]